MVKMLCPAWVLALAVLCVSSAEVSGQCWEHALCRDLSSEENILECIQLCRTDLTAETPIFPGDGHLQPPSEADQNGADALPVIPLSPVEEELAPKEFRPRHEEKRSYSMEHFRWGKPVGRKRRPVKVYTNGVEEESAEVFPAEVRRELANNEAALDYPPKASDLSRQEKDGSYKMKHFRWSSPPASKRYGGFMKSWDERNQKPLLTLFKNVIIKDGQQKDQ